ncbi:MAG: T9SS C-terminal target domain-containing protein, partial [Bacteroidetes bacterium]
PNTPVRVQMLRHQFGFGTAFNPRRIAGNSQNDPAYTQRLLNLDGEGHGFNLVVPENALKWRAWEQGWAGSQTEIIHALQWLKDRQVAVRGHVLLWPGWTRMPDDIQTNSQNPGYIENRIANHLDDILNRSGVRSAVREWDVVNEIAHVRDLEYALAGQGNYVSGREIYAEVLKWAKQEDPNLVTYLNDYDILSNGSLQGESYLLFKEFIQEAIDAGGAVDGIGFQAHMGTKLVSPDSLYAILEDCHQTFGKPIKITEYDLPKELPDDKEGQYLHDFLTLVFSHPAIDGFLMWGFWDGAHWKENAPLYYEDWTPKPAHAAFVDLVFDQWWTDTTLTTDSLGQIALRGYKGTYHIEATDLDLQRPFRLSQDTSLTLALYTTSLTPESTGFRLYPQPAGDWATVDLPQSGPWTWRLSDSSGRLVRQGQSQTEEARLSLTGLPAGVYHLQIQTGEKHYMGKLVRQ